MTLTPEEFHPLAELAAEKSSDGVLCLDVEGAIVYANESAVRLLGLSASTLLDRTLFDVAPEMNTALWRELWKEIRAHGSFAFEFGLQAPEERLLQVDMAVHYFKPHRRELACVFFRDIEERKRLKHLQQEFLSTASHELRTPMTVIREGVSQVVEGLRGEVNESQRRALTMALDGIDRLGRIIDDVLDISKMESGKAVLRKERLDLSALARDVGASFQSRAQDRGLELRLNIPVAPVIVYADRDRLVQVITNLMSNAFKFTEKGRIEIQVRSKGGSAECSVSDTGIGLAPADLEKIFNKFEQLGHVAVTGEKGTGLGLSISRAIVELHKGRLWAESPGPGRGAILSFALPQQTGLELFQEQLAPMLHDVARRGGTLSAVFFRVVHSDSEPGPESRVAAILSSLEDLIRAQSGRRTDLVVKDRDALYLALESTVPKEAQRMAEKLIASKGHMTYRITGFPEGGATEETFLQTVARWGSPS